VAVATGREFRTQGSTDVNTQQCPVGQRLVNGVCVPSSGLAAEMVPASLSGTQGVGTGTMQTQPASSVRPTQTSLPSVSSLYGDYRGALQQTTQANIEAAQQTAAQQQTQLQQQLQQQRQDYLTNRQQLQKETFIRGRNILSNLANRGLATSGLLQLGDVQRTIATGQQMTGLSEAFERARQGITGQQQNIQTGLQQFQAGQQSQLAQQLSGLGLQERQANIQEAERITALVEDTISAGQTATPQQASLLNQIYAATAAGDTETLQQLLTQAEVEGAAPQGSLTQAFSAPTGNTVTSLVAGVTQLGGNLSSLEQRKLIDVISDSENLAQGSPFMADLANVQPGTQVTATVRTRGGKAGLNDSYFVQLPSGQEYELDGRELAVLLMNNSISVSPEIALSIAQRAGGSLASGTSVIGNRYDSVLKPYLEWLKKNNITRNTVQNPVRG
jgi:hypothetical protein